MSAQQAHEFATQTVNTEQLDALNCYEPPYVLKLDVEGAELVARQKAG